MDYYSELLLTNAVPDNGYLMSIAGHIILRLLVQSGPLSVCCSCE